MQVQCMYLCASVYMCAYVCTCMRQNDTYIQKIIYEYTGCFKRFMRQMEIVMSHKVAFLNCYLDVSVYYLIV